MKKRFVMFVMVLLCLSTMLMGCGAKETSKSGDGIKVGLVFSLSGSLAVTEKGMANAALLAIDEINGKGGVKGKKLVPILEDMASEPSAAATKAKKLISQDKVAAIIGGYTAASREAIRPIVEQNNSVFIDPTFDEGEVYSKNMILTGQAPNQQLQDFVPWLVKNVGKKFYFIGSDYTYPVETNKQVKALLKLNNGTVVGEQYVPLGQSEFSSVINKIKEANPDVIFSDLVGDSVAAFYKQYKNYGLDPAKMPIASTVTAETEVSAMGADVAKGHISSAAYFQVIDTPENKKFVEAYHKKYGDNESITQVIESSYNAAYLLAQALEKVSDPSKSEELLKVFAGMEFQAPQGKIKVDSENNRTWLFSRIAKVRDDGTFEIMQSSSSPIQPEVWAKLIFPNHEEPWKKK